MSEPASIEYGMNPSARSVGISGWASVGALSVVAAASADHCHVTPDVVSPRHVSLVMTSTRARL